MSLVAVALTVVLLSLVSSVTGYSTGAPISACTDMLPRHGVNPTTSNYPYNISLSSTSYCSTSVITVTISHNNGGTFKGFFCQARRDGQTTPVGKLTGTTGGKATRDGLCGGQGATLTHGDSSVTTSVRFTWNPLSTNTNVRIVCTVVQVRTVYWVQQESAVLNYVQPPNCPTQGLPTICGSNQVCNASVAFSICDVNADADGNCVCPSDMKYVNPTDSSCTPKGLGDSCGAVLDCINEPFSTCLAGTCQCASGYVEQGNGCISGGVSDVTCNVDNDCSRYDNARCNGNRCACIQQAVEGEGECRLKGLDDPCTLSTDCSAVQESVCSGGSCACSSRYKPQDASCVPKEFNDACEMSVDCGLIPGAVCGNSICTCESAFKQDISGCIPKGLGDVCGNINDCSAVGDAVCDLGDTGRCTCAAFFETQDGETCVRIGDVCNEDTCSAIPNSFCISNSIECLCLPAYKERNGQCVPKELGDDCESITDCFDVENSFCGVNDVCECTSAYIESATGQCDNKGLGDPCASSDDCSAVQESVCSGGSCVCSSRYRPEGEGCVPKVLGDQCAGNNDCFDIPNSVCGNGNTRVCVCASSYEERNNVCVLIGDVCNEDTCSSIPNSFCISNSIECLCLPAFKKQNGMCVPKSPGDPCERGSDCNAYTYAVCNANDVCGCLSAYKPSGVGCEKKGLGDSCSSIEDCGAVSNAVCNANMRCDCQDAFKTVDGQCRMKDLNDQCTVNSDCRKVENAACDPTSRRCTCRSAFKPVDGQCGIRRIGDSCEGDENCEGVPMAVCNLGNNKCECMGGYKEQNGQCVPDDLEITCNNNADCSSISGAFCDIIKTRTCNCETGYIRDDNQCIRRVLGDLCKVNDDCRLVDMSECDVNHRCSCKPWYKERDSSNCQIKVLGDPCKYNDDCRGTSYTMCDKEETSTCVCRPEYKQMSNQTQKYCAVRGIGEPCSKTEDCKGIIKARCDVGNTDRCACPPDHKVSLYRCVPKVLNSACTVNADCGAVDYSVCKGDICKCGYGYNTDLSQDKCEPTDFITGGAISTMLISSGTTVACLILQICFGLTKYL